MQTQIQALLAGGVGGREAAPRKVGRQGGGSQIIDGTPSKVAGFITACKLYIRMRMREETVKGQI